MGIDPTGEQEQTSRVHNSMARWVNPSVYVADLAVFNEKIRFLAAIGVDDSPVLNQYPHAAPIEK
jgi:hypothetical protein